METSLSAEWDKMIRRRVEGQIRSFLNDHPEILDTGTTTWKCPPNKTRNQQLMDSIAKRVVLELICPDTKKKLMDALKETV